MHIYRWDLDKTYLETDFSSLRGLVRAATEKAEEKRAVPGAPALLRGLGATDDAQIHILSGSPTQLRAVLEEKLLLDGVRFDSLMLKDNLSNLKRGRFRAIRGQFGYKLPALLAARVDIEPSVSEMLFGDDAEVDALIYSVYGDVISGQLSAGKLSRILEVAGAYSDRIDLALETLTKLQTPAQVDAVFIHLEQGSPPQRFAALGHRVIPIHSWWQAALVLHERQRIGTEVLVQVMDEVVSAEELTPWALGGLAQDLVLRGHASPNVLDGLRDVLTVAQCEAVQRLPDQRPKNAAPPAVDYVTLLHHWDKD